MGLCLPLHQSKIPSPHVHCHHQFAYITTASHLQHTSATITPACFNTSGEQQSSKTIGLSVAIICFHQV
jgi:hypothetical protein